ncbi:MAG: ACT domain-containing protein, partial [Rhodospirillaceae bacterium]|nr:ACT domain-containing protein [Rhodospirillaceae bacterium]
LEFTQTGILAAIAAPLAEVEIPIFSISTFETDYVLVPAARFEQAARVLSVEFSVST